MASLRDIRRRIGSVKNTRKITRAMKLVAGAKMRKAEQAARAAQPYQNTLRSVLGRVIAAEDSIEHPLLSQPENIPAGKHTGYFIGGSLFRPWFVWFFQRSNH